jgi:hypothetical protein
MTTKRFAVYMAKPSGLRYQRVQLRYAACLYDLDLLNLGRKVLPLGYVMEANLRDGTVLSCLLRRDIPEDALYGIGKLARSLFTNSKYVDSIIGSLDQYAREAESRGAESVLSVLLARTMVTSLCVRTARPVPQNVRDMVGFTENTTSEEFETIGFKINEKLAAIPFMSSGITSDKKNTFMFPID